MRARLILPILLVATNLRSSTAADPRRAFTDCRAPSSSRLQTPEPACTALKTTG